MVTLTILSRNFSLWMFPIAKSSSSSVLGFHWKGSAIEKSHQVKRDVEMSPNGKKCLCCGDLGAHTYIQMVKSKCNLSGLCWINRYLVSTQCWYLVSIQRWFPQIRYVSTFPLIVWPAWPWDVINGFANQQIVIHCLKVCIQYIVIHSIHCNSLQQYIVIHSLLCNTFDTL